MRDTSKVVAISSERACGAVRAHANWGGDQGAALAAAVSGGSLTVAGARSRRSDGVCRLGLHMVLLLSYKFFGDRADFRDDFFFDRLGVQLKDGHT